MTRIATYVFLDLETTGIPVEEHNKTRITELSLVAVKRRHLLDAEPGSLPRVLHKLSLCFNPRRMVTWGSTQVTGLCNDLLECETAFDLKVFAMIDTFLSVLSQPVCLVAHNGIRFDYPILKNHIEKLNTKFSVDILCADSLPAFYNIMKKKTGSEDTRDSVAIATASDMNVTETNDTVNGDFNSLNNINLTIKSTNESTPKKSQVSESNASNANINIPAEEPDYGSPPEVKKRKIFNNATQMKTSNARRKLFYGSDEKPAESYKLVDVYHKVVGKRAENAHRAENDCLLMLEICVNLAEQFVDWIDDNRCSFSSIEPMTVGVAM